MNLKRSTLVIPLLLLAGFVLAQNAPVSSIPDTLACNGSQVTIPIRVKSFKNIGSISLKLQYSVGSLGYVSWNNDSGFPGLSLNSSIPGWLTVGGFYSLAGGMTYPDNTVLFSVTFNYSGGSAIINWYDTGPSCEYTGPSPNYPVLNDVPASAYYINGSVNIALIAEFSADNFTPEVGDTVHFNDISTGTILEREWTITPESHIFVNGTNFLSKNPDVVFTGNGAYTVSLHVTNNSCGATKTVENYIHAGTPGLWTGLVSTDWNYPKNWHNWLIPDQLTSVVIPSAAPYYPEYPGDFSIGVQCFNLTIQAGSGQFTVNGNFLVP
jgi:hypothetical protein